MRLIHLELWTCKLLCGCFVCVIYIHFIHSFIHSFVHSFIHSFNACFQNGTQMCTGHSCLWPAFVGSDNALIHASHCGFNDTAAFYLPADFLPNQIRDSMQSQEVNTPLRIDFLFYFIFKLYSWWLRSFRTNRVLGLSPHSLPLYIPTDCCINYSFVNI